MKRILLLFSAAIIGSFFIVGNARAADVFVCHTGSQPPFTCEVYDPTADYSKSCASSGQTSEIVKDQTCQSYMAAQTAIQNNPLLNLQQNIQQSTTAFLANKQNLDPNYAIKSAAQSVLNPVGFSANQGGVLQIIRKVINFLIAVSGMAAMALYIWAGVLWMSAAGNAENVGKAQSILTWTTLGVVGLFSSYVILNFVINIVLRPAV